MRLFSRFVAAASLAMVLPLSLSAQTADTAYFQGVMLPTNEVPAITGFDASGLGTLVAHAVRDANGKVVSGSVDFWIDYKYPQALTATGLHIHKGAADVAAAVVINTGLSGANPYVDASGSGRVERQAQVLPTDTAAVSALQGLFDSPGDYYVNMHSTEYPGGFIRAQLKRAAVTRSMGIMLSANEVPPVANNNSAVSSVTAIAVQDASGVFTSASVIFDVNYTTDSAVTFTGLHIHKGGAGLNGPIEIPTTVSSVPSEASGKGNLHYSVNANVASALVQDGLSGLFNNPGDYYINVHTTVNPGGTARAQLRTTDQLVFPVTMLPSNEVPAIVGYAASGLGQITVNTIRRADGSVEAGIVSFDVNYRFPDSPTVTGLHIHDGTAAVAGPVTINTGLSGTNSLVATPSGNVFKTVTVGDAAGVNTLNSIVRSPQNQYVNLHTSVYGSGIIRAQLGTAPVASPNVTAVISAVSEPTLTNIAPGELISIYGTNLAVASGNLQGFAGGSLPASLNGISATVGDQSAPLVNIAPTLIVAQVPFEAKTGPQPLVVTANGKGSAAFTVNVAPVAPAIFFDATGGIVVRNSDFSLIRPENPARVSDVLVVYCTGLGQGTVPLVTGRPVQGLSQIGLANVSIDNIAAPVYYAIASPAFVGLYQIAFQVPPGVKAGKLKVIVNGTSSNTVSLPLQ